MTHNEQDKVLQALQYFRTHATNDQKKEALLLLERDCKTDVTFDDYISSLH